MLRTHEDPGEKARHWASLLGHDEPAVRREARRRLAALGEGVVEVLAAHRSGDPDVRRSIRSLLRRYRSLRLEIEKQSGPGRVGAQVVLRVSLVNNTEETYVIPLVHGAPTRSLFVIEHEGAGPTSLSPDQVELLSEQARMLILPPDRALKVKITLDGRTSPLRGVGVAWG